MRFRSISIVLAALAAVSLTGCRGAGQAARDRSTVVVRAFDGNVQKDVDTGIRLLEQADTDNTFDRDAAQSIADGFFEAVETGDRWEIATTGMGYWPTVRGYAEDGYQIRVGLGELVPEAVESKTRRLDEFGDLIFRLSQGAKPSTE